MRIVLLGDSHLDHAEKHWWLLGDDVLNAAVGGATVDDLPGQLHGLGLTKDDAVVVSVGTNDAAPWRQVPLGDFRGRAAALLDSLPTRVVVVMTTPGVDESRLTGSGDRTRAVLREYDGVLTAVAHKAGARVVDAQTLLAPLGSQAYVDDGVHLTDAAYRLLLPAVAVAVTEAAADRAAENLQS